MESAGSGTPKRRWWADPLTHFLVLGAAVFALQLAFGAADGADDRAGDGPPARPGATADPTAADADAQRVITLPLGLRADVRRTLAGRLDREPTDAEVEAGVQRWVDTEILVREARALGLHEADPQIRARLAEKMSFVLEARHAGPAPDDKALRARYEAGMERWRQPALYTVRQLFVAGTDERAAARAREVHEEAARLVGADADHAGLQALYDATDTPPGGPVLRGRTLERLVASHGERFAAAVEGAEGDAWALVEGRDGWHVLRVQEERAGRTLSFDEARGRLETRWRAERSREAAEAALSELRGRYDIRDAEAARDP